MDLNYFLHLRKPSAIQIWEPIFEFLKMDDADLNNNIDEHSGDDMQALSAVLRSSNGQRGH